MPPRATAPHRPSPPRTCATRLPAASARGRVAGAPLTVGEWTGAVSHTLGAGVGPTPTEDHLARSTISESEIAREDGHFPLHHVDRPRRRQPLYLRDGSARSESLPLGPLRRRRDRLRNARLRRRPGAPR